MYKNTAVRMLSYSPLSRLDLINTETAARLLFPNERISKKHLRRIQRLCKRAVFECYKIGHNWQIVKASVFYYIENNHYLAVN